MDNQELKDIQLETLRFEQIPRIGSLFPPLPSVGMEAELRYVYKPEVVVKCNVKMEIKDDVIEKWTDTYLDMLLHDAIYTLEDWSNLVKNLYHLKKEGIM